MANREYTRGFDLDMTGFGDRAMNHAARRLYQNQTKADSLPACMAEKARPIETRGSVKLTAHQQPHAPRTVRFHPFRRLAKNTM